MTKSSSSSKREGYQVGVFKDGKMKHIMKIHEASQYIKEKSKKIKDKKPKRNCSDKQLEALAKGRAIREKNRGGSAPGALSAPKVKAKNVHHAKESKVSSKGAANRSRVRREKEQETGKHRKHESAYDSDFSDGPAHSDSGSE